MSLAQNFKTARHAVEVYDQVETDEFEKTHFRIKIKNLDRIVQTGLFVQHKVVLFRRYVKHHRRKNSVPLVEVLNNSEIRI